MMALATLRRGSPYLRPALSMQIRPALSMQLRYVQRARYPTIEEVDYLCRNIREISNESLAVLAYLDCAPAARERLVREIMRVDQVDWETADRKVLEMDHFNDQWAFFMHLPHMIGVFLGVTGAFISIPLVFHRETAVWFNNNFVTQDEPEWESVNTFYEIGTWTWSWMEPVMGTLSFLLLGLQFARANLQNLQMKPYTALVKSLQAKRLAHRYPQYEKEIVKSFAKQDNWSLLRVISKDN